MGIGPSKCRAFAQRSSGESKLSILSLLSYRVHNANHAAERRLLMIYGGTDVVKSPRILQDILRSVTQTISPRSRPLSTSPELQFWSDGESHPLQGRTTKHVRPRIQGALEERLQVMSPSRALRTRSTCRYCPCRRLSNNCGPRCCGD